MKKNDLSGKWTLGMEFIPTEGTWLLETPEKVLNLENMQNTDNPLFLIFNTETEKQETLETKGKL